MSIFGINILSSVDARYSLTTLTTTGELPLTKNN